MEIRFQSHFLVNIWCCIIESQVIRLFLLEEHLTSKHDLHFLEDELPLLEDVPVHIRQEIWLEQDDAHPFVLVGRQLHSSIKFQNWQIGC
jgi:hypothetical protein